MPPVTWSRRAAISSSDPLGGTMNTKLVLISLTLAGCGGQLGDDPGDTAGFLVHPVQPAPAYIEWQFDNCLSEDQRLGLAQALQQLHAQNLPEITPEVGYSNCDGDGQERGGLFPYGTSQASAELTRAAIAIR